MGKTKRSTIEFFCPDDSETSQHVSRMENRTLNLHVGLVHGAVVWVLCDVQ